EPEHLLTGLLADPTATSARLLKANGVKQNIEIEEHSLENSHKIKLSSSSKFVLELALQVVRLQDKKSIRTEHLLWGLVRLSETNTITSNNLFQQYEVDKKALNNQLAEIV
ncbi:MAG: Clp protease N-terminal domain-containing protein, partial [Cyanobacteria bacterium P01_A01_bin.83]